MFGPKITSIPPYGTEPAPAKSSLCDPKLFGRNAVLLTIIPYTLATALQDTNIHLALILGTACSGGLILYGLVCRFAGGHKTWPYALECCLLVVNTVLLGVSYQQKADIIKYHNFIANSVYSAFSVLSLIVASPFTLQYLEEFVPVNMEGHDKLIRSGYQTTSAFTVAFVTNTLIYLVPICKGKEDEHTNALNLVFRIILPICFYAFAVLFARMWPLRVVKHLEMSRGFDAAMRKIHVNPLAGPFEVHAMAV